nr:immunoglobulin light chain junction region [Macaca mulatta]
DYYCCSYTSSDTYIF